MILCVPIYDQYVEIADDDFAAHVALELHNIYIRTYICTIAVFYLLYVGITGSYVGASVSALGKSAKHLGRFADELPQDELTGGFCATTASRRGRIL